MANVVFNVQVDMTQFIGYDESDGIVAKSSTQIVLGTVGEDYDVYYGEGFTFANGAVTGGTATGCTLFADQGVTAEVVVTGLSHSASTIFQKIVTDDIEGLKAFLLDGDDFISGSLDSDLIQGYAGNDRLDGRAGNDTMQGGDGDDTYVVRQSGDVVQESAGASGGVDLVQSYAASHKLADFVENGRIMVDTAANLTGNGLDNILFAGNGNNKLAGGAGIDRVSYAFEDAGVRVSLGTTAAQATGGSGSDTLTSIEHLTGSGFADRLTGSSGPNRIIGDAGNDLINGGGGNDSLTGGDGVDTFRFASVLSTANNTDRITDFSVVDDRIQLENSVFKKLAPTSTGGLKPVNFAANAEGVAQDSNDYIVYDTDSGALFYDADGSGSGAAVRFAILTGQPALTASDIFVT